jgi:hypothetical protein
MDVEVQTMFQAVINICPQRVGHVKSFLVYVAEPSEES